MGIRAPWGGLGPAATRNPVHLRRGSVVERVVDLSLPGPVFGWSHMRTYDSGTPGASGGRHVSWVGSQTRPLLIAESGGGGGVEVLVSATNKRVFSTSSLTPPDDYAATLVKSGGGASEVYTLTEEESGNVFDFYGLDSAIDEENRGRLKQRSNSSYTAGGISGITYSYTLIDGVGKLQTVTTAHPQSWQITYSYIASGTETGNLDKIEVKNGSGTVIEKVEYTYFDELTYKTTSLGDVGDLVQVKVSVLASDGSSWIERITQYRYHRTNADGQDHQLKMVFEPDAVQRAVEGLSGVADAEDLFLKSDSLVDDYASRIFTYYMEDHATNGNLGSDYGGDEFDEYDSGQDYGAVKTETIGGCASCGGSGVGLVKTYYYMNLNGGTSTDPNAVIRIVVEDTATTASPLTVQYRRVWGLNEHSVALREAFIENPEETTIKAWCQSKKLTSNLRVSEHRMPSAHTQIDSDSELAEFLDPTGDSGDNDTDTVSASEGVVYYYEYDSTHGGGGERRTGTLVREGAGPGSRFYVSATDWGDGTNDKPEWLPIARYVYPEPEKTSRSDLTRIKTAGYIYFFHDDDDTQLAVRKTTLPAISLGENGSGDATETYEYYDEEGRLRWRKDGEGYVHYYSFHPETGRLALMARDVETDTGSIPSEITSDGGGTRVAWAGSVPIHTPLWDFNRGGNLPTALNLISEYEYDDLGRQKKTVGAGGDEHHTLYFTDGVMRLPYVDESGDPALPARVTKTDDGGVMLESYLVDPSTVDTSTTSLPTTTSDYVSLAKYDYDDVNGQLEHVDRYHDADGSTHYDDYYRTSYLYDTLGRRAAAIQDVESSRWQVSAQIYDALGRVIETRRGVATTKPTDYDDLDDQPPGTPTDFAGWATLSQTEYDDDGVGDGRVTSSKRYFGTTVANDFTESIPQYTWRGHVRGVDRKDSSGASFGPYSVRDIDWLGRTTATATYEEGTSITWPIDYTAYVTSNSTSRHFLTKTHYDDLGRVYQVQRYPGSEDTKHLLTNNYYDRNGRMVATEDPHGVSTEYAYDGAGRQYQSRTVLELESTTYSSSGEFQYCAPQPSPTLPTSGGDGGVIELSHTVYDDDSNATVQHHFEADHNDTNGLNLNGSDCVRSTSHMWYDSRGRLTTMARYGSGDGSSSDDTWEFNTAPTYDANDEPEWTDSLVYNGYALLTKYGYHADTGRQDLVTFGVRKDTGSDTVTTATKTFYDDLGRRTYVAENWGNFEPPSSLIGGGTNNDEDRVTGFTYNGLGQTVTITAVNEKTVPSPGSTENQVTTYYYEDDYNASLVTCTVYPDSTSTDTSGTDKVTVEYHLDGAVKKRTDQRGVVIEYDYDDLRRVTLEKATMIPGSVDDGVESIGRTYDSIGWVETITSYANDDGTSAVNEIKYDYDDDHGRLIETHQDHSGTVGGAEPSVQYAYDDDADVDDVYTDGLRMDEVTYPDGRAISYGFGTADGLDDRLGRVATASEGGAERMRYQYNGLGRLVTTEYNTSGNLDLLLSADRDQNGTTTSWDRFGRWKTVQWYTGSGGSWVGSRVRDNIKYTYDLAGNRTARNISQNVIPSTASGADIYDQEYAYDGLQRLSGVEQGTANNTSHAITTKEFEQQWTLDQLGNWEHFDQDDDGNGFDLEQEREHSKANELDDFSQGSGQDAWDTPAHDAAGNMTTVPEPTDPTSSVTAKYDAWNRLVEFGSGASYEYDGLHRRITRTEDTTTTHFYYNEQWQCVEERATEGGSATKEYVWNPHYVDSLAMTYDASGTRHFYMHDALFNVTGVVENDADVVERYVYSAYGEVTYLNADFTEESTEDSDIDNEHLFTGRRTDPESGLQYSRFRYYHAAIGRWVSRDPIGYAAGDMSLYGYVGGRVAIRFDPLGLLAQEGACCAPPAPGQINAYNISVSGIMHGTGGVSPTVAGDLMLGIDNLQVILAVVALAEGGAGALTKGSLEQIKDFLTGQISGTISPNGDLIDLAQEWLEQLGGKIEASKGFTLIISVDFLTCEESDFLARCNPFNPCTHRFVKKSKNTVYSGGVGGLFGGQGNFPLPTFQDIQRAIEQAEEAVRDAYEVN